MKCRKIEAVQTQCNGCPALTQMYKNLRNVVYYHEMMYGKKTQFRVQTLAEFMRAKVKVWIPGRTWGRSAQVSVTLQDIKGLLTLTSPLKYSSLPGKGMQWMCCPSNEGTNLLEKDESPRKCWTDWPTSCCKMLHLTGFSLIQFSPAAYDKLQVVNVLIQSLGKTRMLLM